MAGTTGSKQPESYGALVGVRREDNVAATVAPDCEGGISSMKLTYRGRHAAKADHHPERTADRIELFESDEVIDQIVTTTANLGGRESGRIQTTRPDVTAPRAG